MKLKLKVMLNTKKGKFNKKMTLAESFFENAWRVNVLFGLAQIIYFITQKFTELL